MYMNGWIVTLVLGQLAFACLFVWIIAHHRQNRLRQRSEERARMLERFGSGQEMAEFLSSPAGARFFNLLSGQSSHPMKSIAKAVTGGIITLFGGLAFLIVARIAPGMGGGNLYVPAMIGIMIGLGILISAAISAWLYRRAGLLTAKPQQDGLGEER